MSRTRTRRVNQGAESSGFDFPPAFPELQEVKPNLVFNPTYPEPTSSSRMATRQQTSSRMLTRHQSHRIVNKAAPKKRTTNRPTMKDMRQDSQIQRSIRNLDVESLSIVDNEREVGTMSLNDQEDSSSRPGLSKQRSRRPQWGSSGSSGRIRVYGSSGSQRSIGKKTTRSVRRKASPRKKSFEEKESVIVDGDLQDKCQKNAIVF